ncbi:MAG: hypothetical protein EA398_16810 [Deltaproteobacteria bacterium]|nr:MAG: hypothetical protein EA398_16810 [Deltaproteobacteria bacterium]
MALFAVAGLAASCAGPGAAAAPAAVPSGQPEEAIAAAMDGLAEFVAGESGATLGARDVAERIARARVIHVGELHGHPEIHAVQAGIVDAFLDAGVPVAVAVEMLPWTMQDHADLWARGEVDEEEFLTLVDWPRTWGHAFAAYRSLFVSARREGASLLAINAPPGLSRDVFRQGMDGLSPERRRLLPADVDRSDGPYREAVIAALGMHGHLPEDEDERAAIEARFFEAQLVWDETMAASIADALESLPGTVRIVVAAGAMHVAGGGGIPDRVARRVPSVQQVRIVCLPRMEAANLQAAVARAHPGDIVCLPRGGMDGEARGAGEDQGTR